MEKVTRLTVEERAEIHFKEITRTASRWRGLNALPGVGPDDEGDIIAVLVSDDLRRLFRQAERDDTTYWEALQERLPVPILAFFGFQGDDWAPLMVGQANKLYDRLAAEGWFPDRARPEGLN